MALYVQFISSIVGTVEERIEIGTGFMNFFDEKRLDQFFGSNIIDLSHSVKETDVLVHACSNTSERALFASDTHRDVAGKTSVETVDGTPTEAYSEVWVDELITKFSINTGDNTGLKNLGRLIAITSLHEAMHNKVEPFKQKKESGFTIHKKGGGGIAVEGASIVMIDSIWDAPVTARNLTLLSEFFNLPLKQTRRTK